MLHATFAIRVLHKESQMIHSTQQLMGTSVSVQIIQEYYGKQATPTVFATRLGD